MGYGSITVELYPLRSIMEARLHSIRKIWDFAPHNAFPDLIFFQGKWLVALREADLHDDESLGVIRILESQDTYTWHTISIVHHLSFDLRDPKFLSLQDGSLFLYILAISLDPKRKMVTLGSIFLEKSGFGPLFQIAESGHWIWRIAKDKDQYYGVSYRFSVLYDRDSHWVASLFVSRDAKKFEKMLDFDFKGRPSEGSINIVDDQMLIILRQDREDRKALIGRAKKPYTDWNWQKADHYLACPNVVFLNESQAIAAGRLIQLNPYGVFEKTALFEFKGGQTLTRLLTLPSFGDAGYPGLVLDKDKLFVCYYSSQLKKSAIYFAEVHLSF